MRTLFMTGIGLLFAVASQAAPLQVESPDGRVAVMLEVRDGSLFYSIRQDGQPVVNASKLECFAGTRMAVVDSSARENDSVWKPVWGQFSEIRDRHNERLLELTADGRPLRLACRVFNDGAGFRFQGLESSKGRKISWTTEFNVVGGTAFYWGERGSSTADPKRVKRLSPPFVAERADGRATAFLESDLYSAAGFESMRLSVGAGGIVTGSSGTINSGEGQVTPWRVILLGKTVGSLMVNHVVLNLAATCRLKDTDWIKPGKGLWDWRVHGYDRGGFKYGINTESYLRFIDFCAEQGMEYFTIDDFWFSSASNGVMQVAPEVDIEKVMAYAKAKNVKIMLYYDRRKGDFGDEHLFRHYAALGAAGIKYGFMGNKAEFTRRSIDAAAQNRLLINFHDGPCPMAGVERTMPNLIAREFCHGQQDSRRAFTPEQFLRMAVVSPLVGPVDQSNGNFGIVSINAGEREKGPRKKNSYMSTVVSECARCLVVPTGLVTLPDAPEEYRKKADLFEFLRQMPATWDESRVLTDRTGKYISVARRSGDCWFVGTVNNEEPRTLELTLDFPTPGKSYKATLFEDAPDAHGLENPEAYVISTRPVNCGDTLTLKLAAGGGHAMILRPAQ